MRLQTRPLRPPLPLQAGSRSSAMAQLSSASAVHAPANSDIPAPRQRFPQYSRGASQVKQTPEDIRLAAQEQQAHRSGHGRAAPAPATLPFPPAVACASCCYAGIVATMDVGKTLPTIHVRFPNERAGLNMQHYHDSLSKFCFPVPDIRKLSTDDTSTGSSSFVFAVTDETGLRRYGHCLVHRVQRVAVCIVCDFANLGFLGPALRSLLDAFLLAQA